MPLELIFEVFVLVDPPGLICLARTTKWLRRLLMSRSCSHIWRSSLCGVVPKLPDCPEDMNEVTYANLMFVDACHFCDSRQDVYAVWSARMRICAKCVSKEFGNLTPERDWEIPFWESTAHLLLEGFVPKLTIAVKTVRGYSERTLYHVATERLWKAQYAEANDKDQWLEAFVQERQTIVECAAACETWYNHYRTVLLESRKAMVIAHIKKLGWQDELSRMSDWDSKPQDQEIVLKLCRRRKGVTKQVLASLKSFLNTFMEKFRDNRLRGEQNTMYKSRLSILHDVLESYISTLPPGSPYPSMADIFHDPAIGDLIVHTPPGAELNAEDFQRLVPLLPEMILSWKEDMRSRLVSLINHAMPNNTFDANSVLDLAITSFYCEDQVSFHKYAYSEYLHFPSILMHECGSRGSHCDFQAGTPEYVLQTAFNQVSWDQAGCIHFDPERMAVLASVVRLCGLDPRITTRLRMNELDPIIECVACNDSELGRATMRWWGVLLHYLKEHRDMKCMRLVLVDETDAVKVRARFLEEELRQWSEASEWTPLRHDLICNRCPERGNLTALTEHIQSQHGVANPGLDDVRHHDRCYYYSEDVCRFWPPRAIDEEGSWAVLLDGKAKSPWRVTRSESSSA
ncbi:hypothetical protein CVT26_006578 [Gymnopilus dilepis]|uniref:F-box domain-containing protein n=1 Tax=Gymnopilus dilepis TaxID=231916 RepID=A0A409Y2S3_9AGAR|nr:hypothetical protein CVT26_006578 [Gymnopilus dilepis]